MFRDELSGIEIAERHAGRGDGVAGLEALRDLLIEREQLGEQIFLRVEAVGGEDGGVAFFNGFWQTRATNFASFCSRAMATESSRHKERAASTSGALLPRATGF
jgi:hypothetical protein